MTVIPFSQALRERTWTGHGESESAGFMHDLMTGDGSREDYTALVVQHYFVYRALEQVVDRFRDDPVAALDAIAAHITTTSPTSPRTRPAVPAQARH